MMSPSSMVMANAANVYRAVSRTDSDKDGAPRFTYPPNPTYRNEPCTIQGRAQEVDGGAQRRITQLTSYVVIFGRLLAIGPNDMIQYVDVNGSRRTLYVESIEDMAGRGAAFKVYAQERL